MTMRSRHGRIGIVPPVVALVVLLGTGAATFGPLFTTDQESGYVTGPVPEAWLHGLASLHAGDATAALQQLTLAESQSGIADPGLLRARLHAALLTGNIVDAELTVEKLTARTPAEPLRAFVFGFTEFARCDRAGREAEQPGADPTAFDRAIRHATLAARSFREASIAHENGDWPAARRNAERALIRRTTLQRKKDQFQRDQKTEKDAPQEPDPEEFQQVEEELRLDEDQGLLSAAELQALLQRLAQAKEEKLGVRRAARSTRSANVERDW